MDDSPKPTVAVVGRGRLGNSLAAGIARAGYRVTSLGRENSTDPGALATSDVIFLTVPDGQISPVAATLPVRPGQFVVHCSGALGREELGAAEGRGAITGCFHPLQTFPSRSPQPDRFHGIAVGMEGADHAAALLEAIASEIGARPFRMDGVDRALYHAAAVVASNHVVALASAAARLWAMAGLPPARGREALAPLTLAAATNIANMELSDALTGPVARGDTETVARHLDALEQDPGLRDLYRRLSLELLELPLALDPARREELLRLLSR